MKTSVSPKTIPPVSFASKSLRRAILSASILTLIGLGVPVRAADYTVFADVTFPSLTIDDNSSLTSSGGSFTLTITDPVNINNGTLTLFGSIGLASASAIIGAQVPGTAGVVVTGSDANWTNTNLIYIGGDGSNASLTLTGGGTMNTGGAVVGNGTNSTNNTVLVTGSGSQWNITNAVHIGGAGGGNTLTISAGGAVASGGVVLGNDSTSSGNQATVTGTGSTWSTASVVVGNNGSENVLTVSNGGVLDVQNNALYVGLNAGSGSNSLVVSGGEVKNVTYLFVGNGGASNTMSISNGGKVTSSDANIGSQLASTGNTVTVSGPGSLWNMKGLLYVGENGSGNSIIISNGGQITMTTASQDAVIGLNATSSSNSITVTGSGSHFSNLATIYVGRSGTGNRLEILNGGTVTGHNARIGGDATSNDNVAIVDGAGSLWSGDGTLRIGSYGSNNTLQITNGGTVQMAGNTFLGYFSTSSSNSVLVSGSGSTFGSGALYIGRDGAANSVTVTNGAALISSTITLGADAGSGGTLNIGSTDRLGTAGTITASALIGGLGTAVINFNQTDSTTISIPIGGSISVNQLGSGMTNLTGSNTYTGSTVVESGTLAINGSISSGAAVLGGVLSGTGHIGGSVVNSGMVSPGNSPGELTIAGDYTQTSAGTLLVQLASASLYDKLTVGGAATLDGALQVELLNGFTTKRGNVFAFLTADSVTGTFTGMPAGTLLDTATVLQLQLAYSGTSVSLVTVQGSFAAVDGLTPNERAVAKALDKIADKTSAAKLIDTLDAVSKASIPRTLERIVPTDLIPMFDAVIASAQTQAFNLERRMGEIQNGATGFSASGLSLADPHGTRSYNGSTDGKQVVGKDGKELTPAPIDNRWGFFINGSGEFVDEESTSIVHGTDFATGGITTGADYRLGDHAAFGLAAGYANTSGNGKTDGAVKIDSGKLALYGTVFDGGFFLNGALGGGLNSYDTKRETLGGTARGDATGNDFNALLGTGYTYRKGGFSAGPIASMRYSWVGIDSFTEHGSLAPLKVGDQSEASLKSTAGLQASYAFEVGKTWVTPQVRAQWQHEYLDTTRGIGASFVPGGNFTVTGPNVGRDSLLLDVGALVQLTPSTGVYAFYTGDLGRSNYSSHSVNGGVQISF